MDLVPFAALGVLGNNVPVIAGVVQPGCDSPSRNGARPWRPGTVGQGVLDRWAAPRIPSATSYLLAWRSVERETRLELATFCLERI